MTNIWELAAIYFTIVVVLSFVFGLYEDDEMLVVPAALLWPFTVVVLAGLGALYLIYIPFKLARHVDKRLTPQETTETNDG